MSRVCKPTRVFACNIPKVAKDNHERIRELKEDVARPDSEYCLLCKPSSKSVCGCETCGKKHKALLSDLLRENYEVCASKRTRKGLGSSDEEKIRQLFASKGCEYVGPYVNNKTPTKYVCSCGKEAEVKVHTIKENWKGCRECSYKARAEALRK
nr:hypothetical protein MarQu_294 [Marseillevirus sp.]